MPPTWHATGVKIFEIDETGIPRWKRKLARFLNAPTSVVGLIVFPFFGWAWVELVGPGETINDDVSYYRDHLGLSSDPQSAPPVLGDSRAWIDPEVRLVATVKGEEFATYEPITVKVKKELRRRRLIHLIVVSGVELGPKRAVQQQDLASALDDGRLITGIIYLAERIALFILTGRRDFANYLEQRVPQVRWRGDPAGLVEEGALL